MSEEAAGPPIGGRYRLVRSLGKGAAGEAWLCQDLNDGSLVVVKLLLRARAQDSKNWERFRREVKALHKIQHPHVVRILGAGVCEARGQPYFVMSHAPGVSLGKMLFTEGHLEVGRALRLTQQLVSAVDAFHRQGVLHRDLKPDNLLVEHPGSRSEHLRVLDFGLAKHLEGGQRTQAELTGDKVVGTPLYLAPEQCRAKKISSSADIYAVGCILMELLSGKPPYSGKVYEVLRGHCKMPAPRLAQRCPDLAGDVDELVNECLRKEAKRRPKATELLQRLERLIKAHVPPEAATLERPLGELMGAPSTAIYRGVLPTPPVRSAGATTSAGGTILDGTVLAFPEDPPEAARPDALLPDFGPALRYVLDLGGGTGRIFVFGGTRLRFGRDRRDAAGNGNDLMLRAYPRPGEAKGETARRSQRVSGRHGRFLFTRQWVAVEDLDSRQGTLLNGERLPPQQPRDLPESFQLSLPGGLDLTGWVLRAPRGLTATHPVGGLRLQRLHEAQHLLYLFIYGEVVMGSAPGDGVQLSYRGVQPGQASLLFHQRSLAIRALGGDGSVSVAGQGPLRQGQVARLQHGAEVRLGSLPLRVALAQDEDMKPRPSSL